MSMTLHSFNIAGLCFEQQRMHLVQVDRIAISYNRNRCETKDEVQASSRAMHPWKYLNAVHSVSSHGLVDDTR